ncbi:uncharacterized protein LOC115126257 [Oncorhynchus nerka]|uniref:uncharacterized protein LOC115126257 n=1 Tax=Oncorhynchus nerka TaxID=8023 RepID=UPI0011321C0F|nr:uncharacterized protein LOC115126257 [Oncorhynchus nerka]
MHWLPLVAMVIASALPFPHSPVTSTVAAMTEPGSSLDNHTEDIDDSSSRSPGSYSTRPAPQASVDYNSHSNASLKDYNVTADSGRADSTKRLSVTGVKKDYNNPSIINEEVKTLKGKRKQQSYLSKSNFPTENTNSVGLNKYSNTDGGKLRSTNGSSHQDYPSQENYVLGDYKPDSSRAGDDSSFRDMAQKENHHNSLDPRTDEQDLRPPNMYVVETYKPSTNAGYHSKTEPDRSSQRTPQRAEARTESSDNRGEERREGGPGAVAGKGPNLSEEGMEVGLGLGLGQGLGGVKEKQELLFLDAHPRVLFSSSPPEHPPLLLMLESGMLPIEGEDKEEEEEEVSDADGHMEGHGDREMDRSVPLSWVDTLRGAREPPLPAPRHKRSHLSHTRRGEMPVCESESVWVTDKTTVIDDRGKTVNIVPEIKTVKGALKQYFYETRCLQEGQQRGGGPQREAGGAGASAAGTGTGPVGVSGASCRGVDIRQWVSQCKAKDTYVRALTVDNNGLQGWRWVRINSSCVCVLLSRVTRKNRGRE